MFLLFLVLGEFEEVREAREAFSKMRRAFRKYEDAMRRAAPVYDASLPEGGPPFDMWHALEMLDRGRKKVASQLEEQEKWWEGMGIS